MQIINLIKLSLQYLDLIYFTSSSVFDAFLSIHFKDLMNEKMFNINYVKNCTKNLMYRL